MKDYRPRVRVMAEMAAGRSRLDRGDRKGALGRFDRAVAMDPNCAQAVLYRGGLRLLAGDDDGAVADFRAMSRLDHEHLPAYRDLTTLSAEEFPALLQACDRLRGRHGGVAWLHVFRAFSLRSLMRYEEAVKDLDRAVACEPRSASLWAMRARVKLTNRRGIYDGVRDMRRAVGLEPRWGWLQCWLGEALRHVGRHDEALRALDRGLALAPRYRRGYAWRGGVLVALGRHREALRSIRLALAWDPIYFFDFEYTADQKSWAYNQRMLARRGLGDIPAALRDLNRAHALGPRYQWVYNPGGDPAVLRAALGELDGALRRSPRLAWAWAWRGWTNHQHGQNPEALADLERALRLSPSAWALAWKGRVLYCLGRLPEALVTLDRAVRRGPAYAPARGWRGEALRALGRLPAAIQEFTQCLRLDHRAAWALAGRGECRQRLGRGDEALADLDRALGICPDYAEALGWRAETLRLSGRNQEALRDADAALRRKPGLVLVYLTRSLIKASMKDLRGQIRDFKTAARLDPGLVRGTA